MTLSDMLFYVLVFLAGGWIGWFIRTWFIVLQIAHNPSKMIATLQEIQKLKSADTPLNESTGKGPELDIQEMDGKWYVYRKDTGQFISQGADFDAAIAAVQERYPDEQFWYRSNQST